MFALLFAYTLGIYRNHPTEIDKLPSTLLFAAQLIFCCIAEDFAFYFSHRTLHTPALYKKIHKIHHENRVVYCLSAIHAHPIEYMFGNLGPLILGPLILGSRMHTISVFGWYFVRTSETIDSHCGYSFPWSPFRILPF